VRVRSRPAIATCAPKSAKPSAVALPMPLVPPVTRTVLPSKDPRDMAVVFMPPHCAPIA